MHSTMNVVSTKNVRITLQDCVLQGDLTLPNSAMGLVIFVHGSGSSRLSPRNQFVAQRLNESGLATLLFDLLTTDEERIDVETREFRFDIGLLATRLEEVTQWCRAQPTIGQLPMGYFGASTGAAAALIAAVQEPGVAAVVSRGGRPDLAMPILGLVKAPTLLIVGARDTEVLHLNEQALAKLQAPKKLVQIAHATHLFEESNTLSQAADVACDWFTTYLAPQEDA